MMRARYFIINARNPCKIRAETTLYANGYADVHSSAKILTPCRQLLTVLERDTLTLSFFG
jgi:hypothetical protein